MNANNDLDLKAALEAKKIIAALEMKLRTLRAMNDSIKLSGQDGLPKTPTNASPVEDDVIRIIEAERELEAAQNKWRMAATRIALELYRRLICVTRPNLDAFNVLLKRYVRCLPFKEICAETDYSSSRVFALHRIGLRMWDKGAITDDGTTKAVC